MKPLFSIIIPTLNEEIFLPKLLSNLQKQTDKNFEVIVVDAQSTDRTKEKSENFRSSLNLRFFEVDRKNLSYQRNYGASKAKGKYLIFLDADSSVGSAFIKKLHREAQKTKYLVYFPTIVPQRGNYSDKILFKVGSFLVEFSQNLPKHLSTGGAVIFQKDYFNFIGGYAVQKEHERKLLFSEDHELLSRVGQSGVRGKLLHGVKVGFSLRRMKKEGRFNVLRKYILATADWILKGEVSRGISYEMGGQFYKEPEPKTKNKFKDLLSQLKTS